MRARGAHDRRIPGACRPRGRTGGARAAGLQGLAGVHRGRHARALARPRPRTRASSATARSAATCTRTRARTTPSTPSTPTPACTSPPAGARPIRTSGSSASRTFPARCSGCATRSPARDAPRYIAVYQQPETIDKQGDIGRTLRTRYRHVATIEGVPIWRLRDVRVALLDAVHGAAVRVPREERHGRQIVLVGHDARIAPDLLAALRDRDEVIGRRRDDHEVRARDVLELLTAGRAGPGVGADREPVAVVGVLTGVLGDLLVVPDDLLDRKQHGAVIHSRRIAAPHGCRARRPSSRLRARSLGGRYPEPRRATQRVARHPADAFEGARCCANCRSPPRRSQIEELELVDAAAQVSAWCGEPLLYDGDDPAIALAPGTARRRALDAAREEIAAGPGGSEPCLALPLLAHARPGAGARQWIRPRWPTG